MKKIVNGLLSFLKYLFLLLSFGLTLFIILKMYTRLNKSLDSAVVIFIPYLILLLLFLINSFLRREGVTKNLFYNMTATLVFLTNIFVCLRAIFDQYMLFNGIQKMGVNFNYFNDYLSFNRIMLYGLIIGDIVFMFVPATDWKKSLDEISDEVIARKIEVNDPEDQKKDKQLDKNIDREKVQKENENMISDGHQEKSMVFPIKTNEDKDQDVNQEKGTEIDEELI